MVYDSEAQKLAVKAIGTVESNLNYSGIYYADPITVGFMQWYGTRAAALLNRIRSENSGSWVGVEGSLTSALDANPATDSQYWTNRYLTRAEGESLKPVLENNKPIQNNQATVDLDAYVDTATRNGMDKDVNTNAMLFFFVMYHQSPKRALNILASMGPQSSLDRLHAAALNEPVLGQYRSRYNTARDIILSGDTSGIGDTPGTVPPPEEGGDSGSGTGSQRADGPVKHARAQGDMLLVTLKDNTRVFLYATTGGMYTAARDTNVGAIVPPLPDNPDPEVPPNTNPPSNVQEALVQFVLDRLNRYAYSQGSTRLTPESNLRTDCSGLMNFAFNSVAGINIGTYTGNQYNKGQGIYSGPGSGLTEGILQKGDLIFNGNSSAGPKHVEMYIGGSQTAGHGGPGSGPIVKPLSIRFGQPWIWVRRHV